MKEMKANRPARYINAHPQEFHDLNASSFQLRGIGVALYGSSLTGSVQ